MTTTLAAAYVDDKVSQQLPTAENNDFETRNMPFHNVEPAKNVVVYLNGDRFYPGRKFIVSRKQLHDFDGFLNEVSCLYRLCVIMFIASKFMLFY